MENFSNIIGIVFTLFVTSSALAVDMRQTPLPDNFSRASPLGYSSADVIALFNGTKKQLWTLVPPKGCTNSTYILRDRMFVALGRIGFDQALANVIINVCKVYARDPLHCLVYASAAAIPGLIFVIY